MVNPGSILEPACLYADQGTKELDDLVKVVKQYHCRRAIVHLGDIGFVMERIDRSRISVVVDFPYGRCGSFVLAVTIEKATEYGIKNFDICVDLSKIISGDFKAVQTRIEVVHIASKSTQNDKREIKAIIQLPYLWQYAPGCIDPLICMLARNGVSVIKDWTTVHNFSRQVDVSLTARLESLEYVKRVIRTKQLPLKVKIAGGVRPDNAVEFVKNGADILGVSVQYVPDVIRSLELA